MKNLIFFLVLWLLSLNLIRAQDSSILQFKEYLGYVKKYHPIVKQAELTLGIGQANLMKARGGFDPKLEVDYEIKEFRGSTYYDRLNAAFKIPTWYGIELKGSFQNNDGEYLNPDETLPEDGLYGIGVSVNLGRDSWINERMATLKQAKIFREQTKSDLDLLVNQILYDASLAYFDWLKAYNEVEVYRNFLDNAKIRYQGTRRRAAEGDLAEIDTVEAKIVMQSRALSFEQAQLKLTNQALKLSNFLWMANDVPVELQSNVRPGQNLDAEISSTFEIMGKPLDSFTIENHPKIRSLGYKIDGLEVEQRLKKNRLLPRMNLEFNFLTETPELINSYVSDQYKGGVNFEFPLFLRKERGDLKLIKFKLRDAQYEFDNAQIEIRNRVLTIYNELDSFQAQNTLLENIVFDYNTLLAAEERKFSFGESSLFLINNRETKLIDAELKQIELQNKFYASKAKLFKSLAINPQNI